MNDCQRCGKKHRDPFLNCGFCRRIERIRNTKWREAQLEAGLCYTCLEKQDRSSRYRCKHHLEYDNEFHKAQYADQRKRGLCAYARCQTKSTRFYCDKHAEEQYAQRDKRVARARRALKRAA